jgi:catechol 2,3-dioxygenase-like lactoylglutathione lyase family enzyme
MASDYRFDHAAQVVPDIAETIRWYEQNLAGAGVRVLYSDATWGLVEVGGVRLAFVVRDQHPNHLAWNVSQEELERLAAQHGKEIKPHRDGTRSFYLDAPGGNSVEIIAIAGSRYEEMIRAA